MSIEHFKNMVDVQKEVNIPCDACGGWRKHSYVGLGELKSYVNYAAEQTTIGAVGERYYKETASLYPLLYRCEAGHVRQFGNIGEGKLSWA